MNTRHLVFYLAALFILTENTQAQEIDNDTAESTIRLMSVAEAELPDAVTKEIKLPESLAENALAYENAALGIESANQNRARREKGLSTAEEARQRSAELTDEAMDNRETRGRSEDRPEPPDPPAPQGPSGGP